MTAILKTLAAYEDYPVLASRDSPEGIDALRLRYVSIIHDLKLFYAWHNDRSSVSNGPLPGEKRRLVSHLRQSLESPYRQSFLVEGATGPVCFFDLALAKLHELYYRMPTSPGDCILNYLLAEKYSGAKLFTQAIRLQLDYFFSYPDQRRLWVCIPMDQPAYQELFLSCGFLSKTEYRSQQRRYGIFYIRRPEASTRAVTSS
jgi:RimJ/RimL family protein N-acetyltransferase